MVWHLISNKPLAEQIIVCFINPYVAMLLDINELYNIKI